MNFSVLNPRGTCVATTAVAAVICLWGALGVAVRARAGIITEPTRTYSVGYTLGDFVDPPVSFEQTVADSTITLLTGVRVGLHLVGAPTGQGWAGDMYVALNKDLAATAVLLNGVGITDSDASGFGYDGWNVTFGDDGALGDVHTAIATSLLLSGDVAPDGRLSPTDLARPAMLSVFDGGTGNGVWRLSVADLSAGGQMRLESWSLTFTGLSPIPEPTPRLGTGLVLLVGVVWACLRYRQ